MKKNKYILLIIWLVFFGCVNQNNNSIKKETPKGKFPQFTNQKTCFDSLSSYQLSKTHEHIKNNIYRNKIDSTYNYSTCDSDGNLYLKQLDETIDINTIQDLGEYWVDKKNVYAEYLTSDGIQIYKLEKANRKSFTTYGKTVYAKDKEHVFDSRHGVIKEADLKTFRPIGIDEETGMSAYGKDKNNYFFWDEIIKDTIEFKKELKLN